MIFVNRIIVDVNIRTKYFKYMHDLIDQICITNTKSCTILLFLFKS